MSETKTIQSYASTTLNVCKSNNNNIELNVGHLNNGVYYLRLSGVNNSKGKLLIK